MNSKDRMARDLAISRPKKAKADKPKVNFGAKVAAVKATTTEYATTTLVVLYIFSALVGGATLLDLVETGERADFLLGALLIAYAVVAFISFINKGVKHNLAKQTNVEGE